MFNRKNQIHDIDAWVEERLSDYLDGTLSPQERAQVEAQLMVSERARASLDSLRWTVSLLKQTPTPVMPRQFTLPTTQRAPVRNAPPWMVWSLRGVAVAATAAFVVLLAGTLWRQMPSNNVAALQQGAPVAPTALVALAPSPLPSFPPAPAQANAPTQDQALTPVLITVEPLATNAEIIPVTVEQPNAQAKPSQTAKQAQNAQPAAPTTDANDAPPTVMIQAQKIKPTEVAAPGSAAGTAPELTTPVATDDAASTQRTFGILGIEGTVTASRLQVRTGPGQQYKGLAVLKHGERVFATGRSQDGAWLFVQVERTDGLLEGWLAAQFVQLNTTPDTLPIVPAPELPASDKPTETPAVNPTGAPNEQPTPTAEGNAQPKAPAQSGPAVNTPSRGGVATRTFFNN